MSATFKTALAALTFAAVLAPAALADPVRSNAPVKTVAYGDLDMSSIKGGETLLARINRAAKQVCKHAPSYKSPLLPAADTLCEREIVDRIVGQLDIEMLTLAWGGPAPTITMAEH